VSQRSNSEEEGHPPEGSGAARGRAHRNPLLIFGIAIFAAVAFYLALIVATQADDIFLPGNELKLPGLDKLPGIDSSSSEAASIEDRINILVMGLDRRTDEPEDASVRTDSMFVVSVDPYSKTAGVFSIPRDLWVEIPDGEGGYFQDRINVAYEYGPIKNYPGGGPGLAMATVEHNFGIEIDHYMVLDFVAFMELVDAVGGIDVNVENRVVDPSYCLTSTCEDRQIVVFEPGMQHMDGERALAYARIRYGSNDLQRIERQQQVIMAAVDAALNAQLLLPNRAVSIYNKFSDAVSTDIGVFNVPGLALLAKQIPPENITTVSLASAVQDATIGDAQVLVADWDKVEVLKRQIFFDGRLRSEAAYVELQNGTGTPGLATDIMGYLTDQGLFAGDITVSDASDGLYHEETVIYDLAGKEYTAKKLAEWLDLPTSRVREVATGELTPVSTSPADIVVVLGVDAQIPES
jgi:LCP family protein required for cell wall assembly